MNDTVKEPVAFFKPVKSANDPREMALALKKYKRQMKQIRERKQ